MEEKVKIGRIFISPKISTAKFVLEDGRGYSIALEEKYEKQIKAILIEVEQEFEKMVQEARKNTDNSTSSYSPTGDYSAIGNFEHYHKACTEEELIKELGSISSIFRVE